MNTETDYTPSESLAKQNYLNTAEEEEYMGTENTQENNNFENMEEPMQTDDYINLIPDYQYDEMGISNSHNNHQQTQEDDRENYGGKFFDWL